MLYIWTDAHPKHIKNTIGTVIQGYQGLQHKIIPAPVILRKEDVMLCLGSKFLDILQKDGYCPKGRTISSMRGKPIPVGEGFAFVSFDPRIQEIDYGKISEVMWDCQLAIRQHNTGQMSPIIGNYRYVADFTDALTHTYQQHKNTGKRVPIACDLETIGLNPYNESAYIVTIFFTYKEGMADGVRFAQGDSMPQKLYEQIEELLTSDKVTIRGANFKFDLAWLWEKWEMRCTNFTMDTTIVGSLLDENRSNSLNTHAKVYTTMGGYDDAFNAKHDKSRMDLVPAEDLLPYAGGDTDACLRVSESMIQKLSQDKELARFYTKLAHPASRAFEFIEQEGVLIDVPHTLALSDELEGAIADLEEQAIAMMPRRLRNKHSGELRLSRDAVIKDFMFTEYGLNLKPLMWTESGLKLKPEERELKHVSSALEHLMMFQNHPEAKRFIDIVKQRSSASKTKATFVDGFLKHLRQDGRYHPTFVLYKGDYGGDSGSDSGTVTGRTALKDPALQCLPCWVKVSTDSGECNILQVIEDYESGKEIRVLTHTGEWKPITGSYRNGIQPLLQISFESGRSITCTENHPILTTTGFVRSDKLQVGDICYGVTGYESGTCLGVREDINNPEALSAERAGYIHERVVSITSAPAEETYDLTIQEHHSFIADGIIVHNTLPKHTNWAKKLRKGYIAPPGYIIVSCDYSQGELRVAACVANERNMIRAYNDGQDLHLKTGATLNGYDMDDLMAIPKKLPNGEDNPEYLLMKKLRQGGKAGNFGLLYAMSAGGYQVYAESTYGVTLTEEQANNQRDAFFDMYPGLLVWHREFKAHAKQYGFVRSPLGRVRHLPLINTPNSQVRSKAERQAINSPIQSCLSDMLQFSFVQFNKEYGQPVDCRCFMMTHDDSKWYVKADKADIWIPRIKSTMENLPLHEFEWNPPLKFIADAESGYNLAEMTEL